MKPKRYPSDLTRTQWKRLKRLLPPAKPGGRPRSVNLREVLNGIFYILRGGCAWRMMPTDLPPWSTCYDYFRKWRDAGTWAKINDALRTQVRQRAGRKKSPSMGIIDSQSVKTTERGGPHGKDPFKKVNGRKRHLVVDTLGMVVAAAVHSAGIQDRDGAKRVLGKMVGRFPRLEKIPTDGIYNGGIAEWARGRWLAPGDGSPSRGGDGVQGPEVAVDRGADIRLAGPLPALEQGLRGERGVERILDLCGYDSFHAPAPRSSLIEAFRTPFELRQQ